MKQCTWCGNGRATMVKMDAAGVKHHFHKKCWKEHLQWLTSLVVPPKVQDNNDVKYES